MNVQRDHRNSEADVISKCSSALNAWTNARSQVKAAEESIHEIRRSAQYLHQRYDRAVTRGWTDEAKTFGRRYDQALSKLQDAKVELSTLKQEASRHMDRLSDTFDELPDGLRKRILDNLRSNTRLAGQA